jgi:hypothetical protein
METKMFKTVLAAAAFATMIAVAPVTSAHASPDIDFGFTIETPHGSISFGDDDYDAPDYEMSCWEAKDYLKSYFHKVKKIECNGDIYTFKVRENGWSPWQIVKIDSDNGAYWFV